jgi:hypothetical protein
LASFHLNIEDGARHDIWLDMTVVLSVQMPRLKRLGLVGVPFTGVPRFDAGKLQQVTLVDIEVDDERVITFPQATHLSIYSDRIKTCPPTSTITTANTSLVHLTLSIWEWDDMAVIEGTFPCLTKLSLLGGCQLQPGLLGDFNAPALETLEIGLWQIEDLMELDSCQGIPFSRLTTLSFGWTAADRLHEVVSLVGGILRRSPSLQLLEVDPSASIQCELTCLLALLSRLTEMEGSAFQLKLNDITEVIPNGRGRLEIHDELAKKYGLVEDDGIVHQDTYLTTMESWFTT